MFIKLEMPTARKKAKKKARKKARNKESSYGLVPSKYSMTPEARKKLMALRTPSGYTSEEWDKKLRAFQRFRDSPEGRALAKTERKVIRKKGTVKATPTKDFPGGRKKAKKKARKK